MNRLDMTNSPKVGNVTMKQEFMNSRVSREAKARAALLRKIYGSPSGVVGIPFGSFRKIAYTVLQSISTQSTTLPYKRGEG